MAVRVMTMITDALTIAAMREWRSGARTLLFGPCRPG
jgi:hypothetical protein